MKELYSIDQKFAQALDSEISVSLKIFCFFYFIKARKDGENRMLRSLEDKFNLVRSEVVREGKLRTESIDQLNQCLEVKII